MEEDLEKSAKQAISLPSSIDTMIHSINNFAYASETFLNLSSSFPLASGPRDQQSVVISWPTNLRPQPIKSLLHKF